RPTGPSSSYDEQARSERKAVLYNELKGLIPPEPGLRLLSLDDGGARGLSTLLLLGNLTQSIEYVSRKAVKPCDYFDIIAGSGTGGLIALLLGRFRMSVEHAIECYTRIVDRVFFRTKADGTFRVTPFEEVLKEISNRFGDGDDSQLITNSGSQCKTFVCVREDNQSGSIQLRRLRTYVHPSEPPFQTTFIEAIRATMGNTVFFKPITITSESGAVSTLLDAGDAHCNPVFDLLEEARSLYPSRRISYLLSIGAGRASTIDSSPSRGFLHQPRLGLSCLAAMQHLANCCDAIALAFQQQNPELERSYFRFNLDQGVSDGKMNQWEQPEVLKEWTRPYCVAVQKPLWTVVTSMMHERNVVQGYNRKRSH
ncbi:acyl transferase/acyl hydrolase/lysophospholipase, partial [Schizophyllum commune]